MEGNNNYYKRRHDLKIYILFPANEISHIFHQVPFQIHIPAMIMHFPRKSSVGVLPLISIICCTEQPVLIKINVNMLYRFRMKLLSALQADYALLLQLSSKANIFQVELKPFVSVKLFQRSSIDCRSKMNSKNQFYLVIDHSHMLYTRLSI